MFEVIINTISTGRVQRKCFASIGEAQRCAENWRAKNCSRTRTSYIVELVRHEAPVICPLEERANVAEAA